MTKYKITFDLNVEDAINYDSYQQHVDIIEIDDDCFIKMFKSKDNIQEFQNWYNADVLEDDKINIVNIEYYGDGEKACMLYVTLTSELQDMSNFANELVFYLFEGDYPKVKYHITGTMTQDCWDYVHGSPDECLIKIDDYLNEDIKSYSNVKIVKL